MYVHVNLVGRGLQAKVVKKENEDFFFLVKYVGTSNISSSASFSVFAFSLL